MKIAIVCAIGAMGVVQAERQIASRGLSHERGVLKSRRDGAGARLRAERSGWRSHFRRF